MFTTHTKITKESVDMALGQNLVALVNIKIAGKWVFTPLTLIIMGFDTHPYILSVCQQLSTDCELSFLQALNSLNLTGIAVSDSGFHNILVTCETFETNLPYTNQNRKYVYWKA